MFVAEIFECLDISASTDAMCARDPFAQESVKSLLKFFEIWPTVHSGPPSSLGGLSSASLLLFASINVIMRSVPKHQPLRSFFPEMLSGATGSCLI